MSASGLRFKGGIGRRAGAAVGASRIVRQIVAVVVEDARGVGLTVVALGARRKDIAGQMQRTAKIVDAAAAVGRRVTGEGVVGRDRGFKRTVTDSTPKTVALLPEKVLALTVAVPLLSGHRRCCRRCWRRTCCGSPSARPGCS